MLFSKISVNDGWNFFNHYSFIEGSITKDSMNELWFYILETGVLNIRRDYDTFFYTDQTGRFDIVKECSPEKRDEECILFSVSKDTYTGKYMNLFGSDSVIDYSKSVSLYNRLGFGECFFEEDDLVCYADTNSGGFGDDSSCNGSYLLDSTTLDGESIVLHVKPRADYCEAGIDPVQFASQYASEYKITFKQDSIGNWYWVSSQKVK